MKELTESQKELEIFVNETVLRQLNVYRKGRDEVILLTNAYTPLECLINAITDSVFANIRNSERACVDFQTALETLTSGEVDLSYGDAVNLSISKYHKHIVDLGYTKPLRVFDKDILEIPAVQRLVLSACTMNNSNYCLASEKQIKDFGLLVGE